MGLITGTRLAQYEIVAPLGAGGMGEVYRARDTRLGRDVAIKVLPPDVAADAERLARFEREAQVLASLNHSNIAHIHGVEDSSGTLALVMELVEGSTLADRIAKGPIPLDEALVIAIQIAEGLEAAHEHGIVHRDLKPANIKVRDDGIVKILDFGLAKALEPKSPNAVNATQSPTITTPAMMTGIGVILGTAAYMSPEQAKGRSVDKRSDVWAFGCVVFEMLTGRRPFDGDDVSDTLAAVLRGEPDWDALPHTTPAAVRTLLKGCLEKDPRRRVGDIAAARFVLTNVNTFLLPPPPSVAAPPRTRRGIGFAVAAMIAALSVAVVAWMVRPHETESLVTRFTVPLPADQQLAATGRHVLALSSDGKALVYVANNKLFVRTMSEADAHAIPGLDATLSLSSPIFSPDGRSIAYHSQEDAAIKRVSTAGGAPTTVCASDAAFGMTWDAGVILVGQGARGIARCSENGGAPETIVKVDAGEQAHLPKLLPDGSLMFTLANTSEGVARWDKARIVVQDLKSGARTTVLTGGSDARYLSSGHLVYAVGGVVFAVPFDVKRHVVTGAPAAVVEGVRRPLAMNTGAAQFDVSKTGTLAYVPGPSIAGGGLRALAVADRTGNVTRLTAPASSYVHVRASPDGKRLAVGSENGNDASVWIYDLDGKTSIRRLTIESRNRFPVWSPDGQRVAFQSEREGDAGIFWQRVDGIGPVERLTTAPSGTQHVPESWSPDGRHLAFAAVKDRHYTLSMLSMADRSVAAVAGIESREPIGAAFSRDGHWLAYSSSPQPGGEGSANRTDRGVYVQPFPTNSARYQAPHLQLDFHPVWSSDGRELLYVPTAASGRIAIVTVTTRPSVSFGTPVQVPALVTGGRLSSMTRTFDVLPDNRFVGVTLANAPNASAVDSMHEFRVVLNWLTELTQRVPVP